VLVSERVLREICCVCGALGVLTVMALLVLFMGPIMQFGETIPYGWYSLAAAGVVALILICFIR